MLTILDADAAMDNFDALGHSMSGATFMGLLIGLVAVILIFGAPIIVVLASLRARTNRQKLINDLVLKLAEKGQPIPPELFQEHKQERSRGQRGGIIWAAVGVGLVIFGAFDQDSDLMGIGFIPLMIGLGFFLANRLEQKQDLKEK
jgi:hypothetical protein